MKTVWQFLMDLHKVCHFQTTEGKKCGRASNSELKRWCQQKCVEVNYECLNFDDPMPAFVKSVILFPSNPRKRTTLCFAKETLCQT